MPSSSSHFRRSLCGILIAVFAAVLLFPLFQQIFHFPREKDLSGIRVRTAEFPAWTPKSWRRGEFAATADAWIRDHVGLRGWLIHLNRQLRYSLFGQLETAPLRKRAIVIGKAPVLFENILMIDALRPPQIPPDQMEAFAARLARTQRLLKDRNIAFLVMLAPNKALVYSEDLPPWARKRVSDANSDYRPFIEALARHQVPCLDALALFRELRPQFPDLIPPHGVHWSHHGAWIAWQRAIALINQQGVLPEIPVPATEQLVQDQATSMNDELRAQLNLFFSAHSAPVRSTYPVAAPLPAGTGPMLDALLVGDSFGLTLLDAMARSGLCRSLQLWFYKLRGRDVTPASFDSHQRLYLRHIRDYELGPDPDENGARLLAGKNLVIFVITTFNIDKFSWGFDLLVNRLYGNPAEDALLPRETEVNLAD